MQSPAQKKFISLLSKVDYSKRLHEVFDDFCTLGAYSLAMKFHEDVRDDLKRTFAKYTKEQIAILDEAFTVMVNEMEVSNNDFLGEVFQQCEMGNDRLGQFFTPFAVSEMIAQMSVGDLKTQIEQQHFLMISEPACGSGGMLIAFRNCMITQECNPSRDAFFVAQDVSETAFKMAYLQLSLYGVGAKVIHGNTITMETFRTLYTPVYYLTDWPLRLMLRDVASQSSSMTEVKHESIIETKNHQGNSNEQLNLF